MAITDFADVSKPEDIKADPKVMAAFLKYAKTQHSDENLLFYFNKGNDMKFMYVNYLDPKSKQSVNVSSDITKLAVALGGVANWDHAGWPKIIAAAKKEISSLIMSDIWRRFISTAEAAALLPKKVGDPKKAAKLLGITDVEKLKKAMNATDPKVRDKLLDEIAKEEGMKERAKVLVASLEKAGLL